VTPTTGERSLWVAASEYSICDKETDKAMYLCEKFVEKASGLLGSLYPECARITLDYESEIGTTPPWSPGRQTVAISGQFTKFSYGNIHVRWYENAW
jgi:hypothetical protein